MLEESIPTWVFIPIHNKNDAAIPPVNRLAIVTKLLRPIVAIPLIPCPLVQPPATLAPKTITNPPTTAAGNPTGGLVSLTAGIYCAMVFAPTTTPDAKTRFDRPGLGFDLGSTRLQMYAPTSAYAADTPSVLRVKRTDVACAMPISRPPAMGLSQCRCRVWGARYVAAVIITRQRIS